MDAEEWVVNTEWQSEIRTKDSNVNIANCADNSLAQQIVDEHNAMVGMIRAKSYMNEVCNRAHDM